MIRCRVPAVAAAALICAVPALAQDKLPPLRTGVGGTFAPHAMPKLGGGIEGFQIDLFTEVARRMKREITIDAVSFSTLIPGMQSGRYDFIAAPTTVTKERAENMLFTADVRFAHLRPQDFRRLTRCSPPSGRQDLLRT
jgi:polar amino acid transport system substrate-binding protein